MRFTGRVIDYETGEGLPGATVELWVDNVMLRATAADGKGYFDTGSSTTPDKVRISSTGYQTGVFSFSEVSDDSLFALEKFVKQEEEVIVESVKRNPAIWLGLGLLLLLLANNRKR